MADETTTTTNITDKPLVGTLIGVGVFVGVLFLAAWAIGAGLKKGKA